MYWCSWSCEALSTQQINADILVCMVKMQNRVSNVFCLCFIPSEETRRSDSTEPRIDPDNNHFSTVRSAAEKARIPEKASPSTGILDGRHFTEDADSTKSRGLTDDYDSTKNGMDYRFRGTRRPGSVYRTGKCCDTSILCIWLIRLRKKLSNRITVKKQLEFGVIFVLRLGLQPSVCEPLWDCHWGVSQSSGKTVKIIKPLFSMAS